MKNLFDVRIIVSTAAAVVLAKWIEQYIPTSS